MSRADLDVWGATSSLPDVAELTAQWLEGGIESQPGHAAGGPDEETTDLAGVLAACNRAGFLTHQSQPGGYVVDGWEQRAFVEGFAIDDTLAWLREMVEVTGSGLVLTARRTLPWWRPMAFSGTRGTVVTRRDGKAHIQSGQPLSRWYLRSPWVGYGICGKGAVAEIADAWHVSIVDPEWGRDDLLWPLLDSAAYPHQVRTSLR